MIKIDTVKYHLHIEHKAGVLREVEVRQVYKKQEQAHVRPWGAPDITGRNSEAVPLRPTR